MKAFGSDDVLQHCLNLLSTDRSTLVQLQSQVSSWDQSQQVMNEIKKNYSIEILSTASS